MGKAGFQGISRGLKNPLTHQNKTAHMIIVARSCRVHLPKFTAANFMGFVSSSIR